MIVQFRFRRGTAARWAQKNTVLAPGEPGEEFDTKLFKIGDGVTPWNDLEYSNESSPDADGPDLTLLYENAKV